MGASRRAAVRAIAAALFASLPGCVRTTEIIDGREVPRPNFELTGDAYRLTHRAAHPRPRGASSGVRSSGGEIIGRICGMDVSLDVEHRGDHVQIVGFLEGSTWDVSLSVTDELGVRWIRGRIGPFGVELQLKTNGIVGSVGRRLVYVSQDGDALRGHIRTSSVVAIGTGAPAADRIEIAGRDALWAMQAAEQGAIVPLILTCAWNNNPILRGISLRFGGPPEERAPNSSALYDRGN